MNWDAKSPDPRVRQMAKLGRILLQHFFFMVSWIIFCIFIYPLIDFLPQTETAIVVVLSVLWASIAVGIIRYVISNRRAEANPQTRTLIPFKELSLFRKILVVICYIGIGFTFIILLANPDAAYQTGSSTFTGIFALYLIRRQW